MKKRIKKIFYTTFSILLVAFSINKYLNSSLFEKNLKYILKNMVKINVDFDNLEFKNNNILINNLKLYTLEGKKVADISKSLISLNLLTPTKIDKIVLEKGDFFVEKKGKYFNLLNIIKKKKKSNGSYNRSSYLGKIYLKDIDLKINDKEIKKVNGYIKMGYQKPYNILVNANNSEKINIELESKRNVIKSPLDIFSMKKFSEMNKKSLDLNGKFNNFTINDFLSELLLSNLGIDIKKAKINGSINLNSKMNKPLNVNGDLIVEDILLSYKDYDDQIIFDKLDLNLKDNLLNFNTKTNLDKALINLNGKIDFKNSNVYLNTNIKDLDQTSLNKYRPIKDLNLNINSDKINSDLNFKFSTKDKFSIEDITGVISTKEITVNNNNFKNVSFDLSTIENELNIKSSDINMRNNNINLTLNSNTNVNLSNFNIISKNNIKNHNNFIDLKEANLLINKENQNISLNLNSEKLNGQFNLKDKIFVGNLKATNELNIKYKGNNIKVLPNINDIKYDLNKKEILKGDADLLLLYNKDNLKADFKVLNDKYDVNAILKTSEGNLNIKGSTTKDLKHSYNIHSNNFNYIAYLKKLNLLNLTDLNANNSQINLDIQGMNIDNKLKLNLKSNKDIKLTYKSIPYNISPNIKNVIFDFKKNKITNADVNTNVDISNKANINLKVNLNDKRCDLNALVTSDNSKLIITGVTDKDLNHKYSIKSKYFDVLKLASNMGLVEKEKIKNDTLKLDINSEIYGKNKELKGSFYVESDFGGYIAEYEKAKIYGQINDLINTDIDLKLKFDELWLNYQRLLDVESEIKITKDKVDIKKLANDKVDFKGTYDFKNNYLNLDGNVNSYNVYTTNNLDVNLVLNDVNAKIYGKLNDLKGKINSTDSPVFLNNKKISKLDFNVNIENNVLNIENLNLDDTNLNAKYDIKSKIFDVNLSSTGKIIKEVLKIEDLDFKSKINLKINGTVDSANVLGNIDLEDVKYKDYEFSKIRTNINYVGVDINNLGKTGILNVNRLDVYDKNKKELFTFNDSFDLANINLNYNVVNKEIDLEKLSFLDPNKFQGKLLLNSIFRYSNNEKFASLVLKGSNLKLNNFNVNDLAIDLQGTDKGINISEMYVNYENNPLLMEGYLTYPNVDYNLRLIANDFNLNFLEIAKKVKKSSGLVNLDMYISKNNVEGLIDLENVNIITSDNKFNIKNFNSKVDLNNKTIQLHDISGNLNGGDFKILGKFDIPTISNDFIESKKIILGPINIYGKLENVKIYLKDNEVKLSSEINMKNNIIKGNILLNDTLIKSIPKKRNKKNKFNSYFVNLKDEIIKNILNQYLIDINLETEKNIKVNIPVFAGLVKDIKSEIEAKVKFNMANSNIDVISDIVINSGSFELNHNKFLLEDTYVKTIGPLDPIIKFKAITNYEGDEISITMDGKLSDKNIKFESTSGKTTNEILGLLTFNRAGGLLNFNGFKASNLVGRALETGLNNLVFNNINNTITSSLGLNEFKIKANFDSNQNKNIEDIISNTSTTLYIKNRLLKSNNIFWSAELTVPFDLKTETVKNKLRYDLALSYLLKKGISLNTGIKKPLNISDNVLKNNAVTFYGGVKYEKQYQEFSQIFDDLSTLFKRRESLNSRNKK